MKKVYSRLWAVLCFCFVATLPLSGFAETTNPQAVSDLLNRIGGDGTADRFVTVLDETISTDEVFVITSSDGKPCIKGSTLSAITTGINWYLNHYAHVNLTWNNLTTDLSGTTLPVPSTEETHTSSVDYRYYLNYCTFSYSMSTWTWERWQQEIDWMALHGINMPLQIVGLDVVWKKLLTEDLGYTSDEANDFIAGPCFQAWWGMNNLEGWGGPNPDWWYERQETLCKNILARERELGMEPVLPGYSGMVPSDIGDKGYTATSQGTWCGFIRPYILDPNGSAFATISAKYYARLAEVMGKSTYYSMDPFHEGANTSGIDVASAYKAIYNAMETANSGSKWVIQYWQWSSDQYNVLSQVDKGKLIVLDLFSDAHTHFGEYNGHEAVYCMLHNFGGRTGFYGRLSKIMSDFFTQKSSYSNIKGIGATPEAIETVPILYDALFELPWRASAPDAAEWVKDYTVSRYGQESADAQTAWEKLRTSSLNCQTTLQGPMEAVLCARPALSVGSVSSWGGTDIFYDPQEVAAAAHLLLNAGLSGENYSYDLTDIARQALTDYGYYLLKAINSANSSGDTEAFESRRDKYLQLILDLDDLLNTNKNFMLGRWTQLARSIADEVTGTTTSDKDWLEQDNARTLITTWGAREQSESGGLRDYSYREWGGMMKDFYYDRWKTYFDNLASGSSQPDWFTHDWNWAHSSDYSYSNEPTGTTADVAKTLFESYFLTFTCADNTAYYVYRGFDQDETESISFDAYRGSTFTAPVTLPDGVTATISVDYNNDGEISSDETVEGLTASISATAVTGDVKAVLTLSDGTELAFTLVLKDNITEARTVSVATADASQGSVSIEGTTETSVTNTDAVTLVATPVSGYAFENWTASNGTVISTANPYTYYGAGAETFTANFYVNKWTIPTEDLTDLSTIESYGQYLTALSATWNDHDAVSLYTTDACPESLYHLTDEFTASAGSRFTLSWNGPNTSGLAYCRLSAYVDVNSDGDFDDDGEFIAVIGDKSTAYNSSVAVGTLNVLLPYDATPGITRVRLRFDSSYLTDNLDATTDAMPADASTTRMVYDIPLNITEYADEACTITVQASNTNGTVDANGQSATYTYAAGEEVVLRAYPSEGYVLDCWTDEYDREVPSSWYDGNTIRFKAAENGTYTANFKSEYMTIGEWELEYEESNGGAVITGIGSGSGALDLTATNSVGLTIVGLSTDALKGNTDITSLTLPATLAAFDRYINTSLTGAGTQDVLLTPSTTIPGSSAWTLTLTGTNNGSTFNSWGSGLLATGSSALADSYTNGFQFYLAAAGTLTVKVGSSTESFSAALGSTFSITMQYDGSGTLTLAVTNESGATETKTISQSLADITNFSTAIPSGVNITNLVVEVPLTDSKPFAGCSALTDIYVAAGHDAYSSVDGVLYDATGTSMLAWPEGRLTQRVFQLATSDDTPLYAYAAPLASADGSEVLADENRGVLTADASALSVPQSLWTLVSIDGGFKVEHVNSQRFWGSGNDDGNIEMPTSTTEWHGTYAYEVSIADNIPTVTLGISGGSTYASPSTSGSTVDLTSTATAWNVEEVNAIPVTTTSALWTALCLPVAVVVPEESDAYVFKATSLTNDNSGLKLVSLTPGSILAAGEGVLVSTTEAKTVSFPVSYDDAGTLLTDNLFSGATIQRTSLTAQTFYGLGQGDDGTVGLFLSQGTIVPANKAYLLLSNLPSGTNANALSLFDDTANGIGNVTTDSSSNAAPAVYFDLEGRRVSYPSRGIYVTGDGQKVFVP
ncbi:MAG: alpha-N-acetylglucosaminidase TIM-barrel domain-containing protein [Bacteroidales bacterium]|nr:alpha-N-acetylglucosaminidase TIM-barrel domain-containing protein [Bacteroidales bacterium]